ncbi:hypothetical protein CDD83_5673 [Cordyceps sp. RAO-2017]|nr:hypothetical protein CDD83_5673 [Cordyceps sp. RAO-2017]
MQLSQLFSLATLASAVSAITVSYDQGYDKGDRSLTSVACSDGPNGLITRKHWNFQRDIPRFPFIGGAYDVAGWNSPNCGACWEIKYNGNKIYMLSVDHADNGFNMALGAMNALTNGQAVQLGRVEAEASRTDLKNCGL